MFWLGVLIGLVLGTTASLIVLGLCQAASQADKALGGE